MNTLAQVGNFALDGWREIRYLSGITWQVLILGVKPRYWTRAVRTEFYRQIHSIGVGSTGFVFYVASAVGISVVAQALVWLQVIGQSKSLGALFVVVLIREAVPILTNFLVIGRSGTAMTTELGNMRVAGEVRALRDARTGHGNFLQRFALQPVLHGGGVPHRVAATAHAR